MTMKVKITNEDTSPDRRVKVTAVQGETTSHVATLAPGESAEAWIYIGRTLAVEETPTAKAEPATAAD